jgi:hypothetical protein
MSLGLVEQTMLHFASSTGIVVTGLIERSMLILHTDSANHHSNRSRVLLGG